MVSGILKERDIYISISWQSAKLSCHDGRDDTAGKNECVDRRG